MHNYVTNKGGLIRSELHVFCEGNQILVHFTQSLFVILVDNQTVNRIQSLFRSHLIFVSCLYTEFTWTLNQIARFGSKPSTPLSHTYNTVFFLTFLYCTP